MCGGCGEARSDAVGMASQQRKLRDVQTRFNKAVSVVQNLPKDGMTNATAFGAKCVFNVHLINSSTTIV